jgi:hypothetical protein
MKSILFGFYFFSHKAKLVRFGGLCFVFLGCDWVWELYTDLIGRKGG